MKLFILLLLISCSKSHEETTHAFSLPEELKDCKIFYLASGGVDGSLTVVRCSNSSSTSTTYRCGKNCVRNITVIDSK